MARVLCFIDGFNLYHALDGNRAYHKYKWLDYVAFANCYVMGRDRLAGVYLFTAYSTWDPRKKARHQRYLAAAREAGVQIVLGKFKMRDQKCRYCGRTYKKPEEKRTDVNLAIRILRCAYMDMFDKAVLITGDSDIAPAVQAAREMRPEKEIALVVPIGRSATELQHVCTGRLKMTESHLARSQLPDTMPLSNGRVVTRPESWR